MFCFVRTDLVVDGAPLFNLVVGVALVSAVEAILGQDGVARELGSAHEGGRCPLGDVEDPAVFNLIIFYFCIARDNNSSSSSNKNSTRGIGIGGGGLPMINITLGKGMMAKEIICCRIFPC